MAIIKFKREKSIKNRGPWEIYVDNTLSASLRNDEVIEITVSTGHHSFTLGFPKFQTDPIEFDIAENETIKYRCYYPSLFAHLINFTDKWMPSVYPIIVRIKLQ